MPRKTKTPLQSNDATQILKNSGFVVSDFARYVDRRGMIRFVARKTGTFGVENHGWREVSRAEAERIQHANSEMKRGYMKPKMKKYF